MSELFVSWFRTRLELSKLFISWFRTRLNFPKLFISCHERGRVLQISIFTRKPIEDSRKKLEYDLYYAKNYTPFLDLVILLQTVRVILWPEGAR